MIKAAADAEKCMLKPLKGTESLSNNRACWTRSNCSLDCTRIKLTFSCEKAHQNADSKANGSYNYDDKISLGNLWAANLFQHAVKSESKLIVQKLNFDASPMEKPKAIRAKGSFTCVNPRWDFKQTQYVLGVRCARYRIFHEGP
jgi:hypothetical protein